MEEVEKKEPIKRGNLYYCPFDCSDKRYPKKKWKTEKGAIKHVESCYMQPKAVEEREKDKEIQKQKDIVKAGEDKIIYEANNLKAQEVAKYKIGDVIYFVDSYVTKPTHEQRGSRMVKVRYEEVRYYFATSDKVERITGSDKAVLYNGKVPESCIFESKEAAEVSATTIQKDHLEANEFAARCR